jgi:hypothetical protein
MDFYFEFLILQRVNQLLNKENIEKKDIEELKESLEEIISQKKKHCTLYIHQADESIKDK